MKHLSLLPLAQRAHSRLFHFAATASLLVMGVPAHAQTSGGGIFDGITNTACSFLKPLIGSQSKVLSLIFLLLLLVMLVLWWMNENKEGMIVWVLRTACVIGLLVNAFTIPPLLGMAPVCS